MLSFIFCCGESKVDKNKIYKLIQLADNELCKKCDFFEISRNLDQFRLLKKLILNEGQCSLLNCREIKILKTENEIDDTITEEQSKKDIIAYLRNRQESGTLNQIDKVLMKYAKIELKDIIKSELNI